MCVCVHTDHGLETDMPWTAQRKAWGRKAVPALAEIDDFRLPFREILIYIRKTSVHYGIFSFCFLGPHPQHMEVPRPGVKSEPKLPDYTTATATWDPQPTEQVQGSNPSPHGS